MRKTLFFLGIALTPLGVYAQTVDTILDSFFGSSGNIFEYIIEALGGIAFLIFVWGIVQMIYGLGASDAESEKARAEGKKRMVWGLIGLFVLVSVWGLVQILTDMFDVTPSGSTGHDAPIIEWSNN